MVPEPTVAFRLATSTSGPIWLLAEPNPASGRRARRGREAALCQPITGRQAAASGRKRAAAEICSDRP